MTLAQPNYKSRFATAVSPILEDPQEQMVFVDVGARGTLDPVWGQFHSISEKIGFEIDAEECERLRIQSKDNPRENFYPYCISDTDGRKEFFVTKLPHSSGLYQANERWVSRFPFTTLDVIDSMTVETITLDNFIEKEAIKHIDFLKIDTEGGELDVLTGARASISNGYILGIKTEFWWDPVIKGQASFAEIDIYLRENGFRFFDLKLGYYPRAVLPVGDLRATKGPTGHEINLLKQNQRYGQAFTGDALYFRDPVGEEREGTLASHWNKFNLLRLCAILDAYHYGDCAIEILETFRSTFFADIDVDGLMDSLVPEVDGRILSFGRYFEISTRVRAAQNLRKYGLSDWEPPRLQYTHRADY